MSTALCPDEEQRRRGQQAVGPAVLVLAVGAEVVAGHPFASERADLVPLRDVAEAERAVVVVEAELEAAVGVAEEAAEDEADVAFLVACEGHAGGIAPGEARDHAAVEPLHFAADEAAVVLAFPTARLDGEHALVGGSRGAFVAWVAALEAEA